MSKKRSRTESDPLRRQAEEALAHSPPPEIDAMSSPQELTGLVHELRVHEIELELQNEELRRAQQELERARDRYLDLYDFAPVGYVTLDGEGRVREANLTAATMLGAERAKLVGRRLSEFVTAGDQDAWYRHLRRMQAGGMSQSCQLQFERADRSRTDVQVECNSSHEPAGLRLGLIDISERKRAEEQARQLEERLRQSQKMEAIGQLAGGVAHDFNNILTSVLGNTDLLRNSFAGLVRTGDPMWEYLGEIERSSLRATDLTRQLLAFARRQVIKPQVINPARLVAELESMLRRLIREDIELRFVCAGETGNIVADPGELQQVIVNLVVNARDAMPQGGTLTVWTSNETVGTGEWVGAPAGERAGGAYVALAVSDTGVGMDEQTRRRMFEPFFTTKPDSTATGLGLATVYGIVQRGRGRIEVESDLGKGTTIRVMWPATNAAEAVEPQPATAERPPRGRETVLLCEDNQAVQEVLARALRESGYDVLATENAAQALREAERHGDRIDLLLTDVLLPGANGAELAETLCQTMPGLKVLLMSGYVHDALGPHNDIRPEMGFLQKPFNSRELLRRVREMLDVKQS